MSVELVYTLIFGAVAAACVAVLIVAIVRGRTPPTRTWAWVTGLVIACLGTAGHLALTAGILVNVATSVDAPPWWLLLGSTSLVAATILAFIRPRWAAWLFAVTALLVPAALAVVEGVMTPTMADVFPAAVVAGFYSVRALIAALFLWWGSRPVRGERPPASPSPERQSETVPIG